MDHNDHVNLLRPANLSSGIYADFGAGSGAFTLALRELVGLDATIYAVDKDRGSLQQLESAHRARFNTNRNLLLLSSDFSRPLDLPPLDVVVMANSLHFFQRQGKDSSSHTQIPKTQRRVITCRIQCGLWQYV